MASVWSLLQVALFSIHSHSHTVLSVWTVSENYLIDALPFVCTYVRVCVCARTHGGWLSS